MGLPEVMIYTAESRFDADGRLVDERSRGRIRRLMEALQEEAART